MTKSTTRHLVRSLRFVLASAIVAGAVSTQLSEREISALRNSGNPSIQRMSSIPTVQRSVPSRRDTVSDLDETLDSLPRHSQVEPRDTGLVRYGLKLFREATPSLFGAAGGAVGPEYALGRVTNWS
jgi:hypothetical protein